MGIVIVLFGKICGEFLRTDRCDNPPQGRLPWHRWRGRNAHDDHSTFLQLDWIERLEAPLSNSSEKRGLECRQYVASGSQTSHGGTRGPPEPGNVAALRGDLDVFASGYLEPESLAAM